MRCPCMSTPARSTESTLERSLTSTPSDFIERSAAADEAAENVGNTRSAHCNRMTWALAGSTTRYSSLMP